MTEEDSKVRENQIDEVLLSESANRYGEDYRSHYFTQYRDYIDSAASISARRHTANTFFLGINTALAGSSGYLNFEDPLLIVIMAGLGITISLAWWGVIGSYRTLNGAKFKVIQLMEKHLPLAPYTAEELAYQTAPVKHTALSRWEAWVPRLFILVHGAIGALNLWEYYQ